MKTVTPNHRLIHAWATALCTAAVLADVHASAVGVYDADIAEALNHAAEEMLCAFERLPEPRTAGGQPHE